MGIQKMIEKKRHSPTYDTTPTPAVCCRQAQKEIPSVRIELTTLGLLDPRSNQLSYEGVRFKCCYLNLKCLQKSICISVSLHLSILAHATAKQAFGSYISVPSRQ